jgi:hypothetical protein
MDVNQLINNNKAQYYKHLTNEGNNPYIKLVSEEIIDNNYKVYLYCTANPGTLIAFYNQGYFNTENIKEEDIKKWTKYIKEANCAAFAFSEINNENNTKLLNKYGFSSITMGGTESMFCELENLKRKATLSEDYEFGEVEKENYDEKINLWLEAFKEFGMPTNDIGFYKKIFSGGISVGKESNLRLFYVKEKKNSKILSIGTIYFDKTYVGVYNMATLNEYR